MICKTYLSASLLESMVCGLGMLLSKTTINYLRTAHSIKFESCLIRKRLHTLHSSNKNLTAEVKHNMLNTKLWIYSSTAFLTKWYSLCISQRR